MAKLELLQGTLDLLVLSSLRKEKMHGFAIGERILRLSGETLAVEEGSLYPALYRLERQGLIEAEWGQSENNRRAKFYSLTRAGRKRLERELDGWRRMSVAVSSVVESV
jgi:PadR family transcriptional regulator, regulatory protein PadR